jgi:hypothetical protein
MLEELITCPLGSKCQEIKNDKIHTCAWYMSIKGIDTQTGEPLDIKRCAIVAQAMLIMDNTKATYGQIQAQANLSEILVNGKSNNTSQQLISKS